MAVDLDFPLTSTTIAPITQDCAVRVSSSAKTTPASSYLESEYGKSSLSEASTPFLAKYKADTSCVFELRCIHAMNECDAVARALAVSTSTDLEATFDELKEYMLKQTELLSKVTEAHDSKSYLEIAGKVLSSICATYSIADGMLLMSKGSIVLGGWRITTGCATLANLLLTECNGYSAIAEAIDSENTQLKENIQFYTPLGISLASFASGAISHVVSFFDPLSSVPYSVLEHLSPLLNGAKLFADGSNQMQVSSLKAQITDIQKDADKTRLKQETFLAALTDTMKICHSSNRIVSQLAKKHSQTLKQMY